MWYALTLPSSITLISYVIAIFILLDIYFILSNKPPVNEKVLSLSRVSLLSFIHNFIYGGGALSISFSLLALFSTVAVALLVERS
ncbi:MAG: hypothetical protein D6769_01355 [Methanobacteriota archaeon]|nr:MAG: hypothetical protein D6769_01355 [Euryarchaeota archaeon]